MYDFVDIKLKKTKKGDVILSPDFIVTRSSDLMIRGKAFYAVWDEKTGMWSQSEYSIRERVDELIANKAQELKISEQSTQITPLYLRDFSNRKWTEWAGFAKNLPDNWHELDAKVTFQNTKVKKTDYVSKRLEYPLLEGDCKNYDELMSTLYDQPERDKLEWAIGSIIAGDSKKIQKFVVLYGDPGSGKSTVIDIIEALFPGYYETFDAKALVSGGNAFALESLKDNPLIAIQADGDLSRIEDNTKLNSLVSHEKMLMNEKHKSQYTIQFHSFLFMSSNKPVKITDSKSGMLRRLIDVSPSGRTLPFRKYDALKSQIPFELGAIAWHCLEKYKSMGRNYYDKYKPTVMMSATNSFYNFVDDNYEFFANPDGVTLGAAWVEYNKYVEEAGVREKYSRMAFKEELKSYFDDFTERDGRGRYKIYSGFRKDKFDYGKIREKEKEESAEGGEYTLKLEHTESIFDKEFADCPAQLAKDDESPDITWSKVKTTLKDIDTSKLHYVLVPEWLIVIDFDLKDAEGNKDPVANLIAASQYRPTYAEFSKSGGGIHLHYIFDGDPLTLSRIIEPGIEVKIFKKQDGTRGYASLRRKLSLCNDLPIAHINSGLPLKKGADDVVSFEGLKSEKAIRTLIMRAIAKEYHGFTAPNVDLIFKTLEDAYKNGVTYDVTDLRTDIVTFASKSHNQAAKCLDLVAKMKFKSEKEHEAISDSEYDRYFKAAMDEGGNGGRNSGSNAGVCSSDHPVGGVDPGSVNYISEEAPIVFFDVEVFPNLLVICWKFDGTPREQTIKMINPTPEEVKGLLKYRLIGFNNRKYDNHILYAAMQGYSNGEIYKISHGMIDSESKKDGGKQYTFGAAYNLSYTDIYDFSSKKQSLKKWEIELGIHHQELGLPWDQPAPEELWQKVADYCVNDVIATEALFHSIPMDFETRKLLADLSGLTVNDPNRSHIIRILVGDDKHPQHVYTDLSTIFPGYEFVEGFTEDNKYFKKNMYRGIDLGFGGYVYGEPGMYTNVALLDVGNMHGASIVALNKFGEHTKNYIEIREARMALKSGRYEDARKLLGGKLNPMIDKIESLPENSEEQLRMVDGLQGAMKLILNSTYGIAAATFDNPLRDKKDKNNIIALRGALFMKTLQDEVVKRGYKVISVKTDSLKVPDATDEIIQFIIDFGKKYGYEFEHECTYEKICLVNDAVYIAKYDDKGVRNKHGKHANEWTATGAQFQQPFVFKTLFSKEPIEHKDLCETKSTSKGLGLYLDMVEYDPKNTDKHDYKFIGKVGQFCPIKPGCGGGILVRENNGKFDAVTGTKKASYDKEAGEEPVYRWLESEVVENLNKWTDVDFSYYTRLVDEAVTDISKYGDFEWFVSDDPVPPVDQLPEFMNVPETDEEALPFV